MSSVVIRKKATDIPEDIKMKMLTDYSQGLSMKDISDKYDHPRKSTENFLSTMINSLASIKETRTLAKPLLASQLKVSISTMNKQWLAKVYQDAEIYAYHYATTNNNIFALEESKLDGDLPGQTSDRAKKFILSARGRYLRSLPEVHTLIQQYRDQRVKDADVGRPLIQSELLMQIEELKELSDENPKYRTHLLRAIELLAKTESVFTENLNITDTSTKTGMEILMDKVKGRTEYEQADSPTTA